MGTWALDDWPVGGISRDHALHVAYSRAIRRAGGRVGGYVRPSDVARRDKWACAACGKPVPGEWTAERLAPVLQLTIPLGPGARYTSRSVRLVHFGCATFADKRLEEAVRRALTGVPSTKMRASGTDTHCTEGHELAGANLLKASDGRRRCRQCRNDREAAGTTPKPAPVQLSAHRGLAGPQ
jgi:hypothetical protein